MWYVRRRTARQRSSRRRRVPVQRVLLLLHGRRVRAAEGRLRRSRAQHARTAAVAGRAAAAGGGRGEHGAGVPSSCQLHRAEQVHAHLADAAARSRRITASSPALSRSTSCRLVGTVEAGLRKCRLGPSSCLPVPASSVGDERGSTAHLRPASLRPHLRRTHQPPLAPDSGESAVQDGRAHVQGHSWNCAVIPESTGSCRRSALSTFPPLCSDEASAGTVRQTVYRRRPGLPSRRTHYLEQSAGQCDLCSVCVDLPSASGNII